ncbi:DUF6275 family protein [Pediococcus acidilactici]|uniref:DUF6275 family protein n=1 Tax=Pediococcus acidilactici TaxID=1254 RepID=UPI000BEEB3AC|nr:DUF6275 family protein [Pediococcus acidilactici]KAF0362198.1 hypothetical protein GBO50_09740 [Pediococcus acidilactici]KAF0365920.1 hypothetical protein GBO55_09775 [Pediococcus acidilactici]KAF0416806.1 hypothetical protein GBO80_09745 [Pediococcus acidilactici]KAF0420490.1 hypothetical protein GBO82_09735 [Pediococcus acidilactici]KAF0468844.1 hypothetical protein GBP06_09420 [Pediococcus acidilactici]
MNEKEFANLCKEKVANYLKEEKGLKVTADDIYIVWLARILQNSKALLSSTFDDGMYFEATYNGDKNQLYLDAYKKEKNIGFDI